MQCKRIECKPFMSLIVNSMQIQIMHKKLNQWEIENNIDC